jgi:hypothetical protein
MVRYDQKVLQRFVDETYERADQLVWSSAIVGALPGAVIIVAALPFLPEDFTGTVIVVGAAIAAAGAYMGYNAGQKQAFELRLEAQRLLLQMKIEENTRDPTTTNKHSRRGAGAESGS